AKMRAHAQHSKEIAGDQLSQYALRLIAVTHSHLNRVKGEHTVKDRILFAQLPEDRIGVSEVKPPTITNRSSCLTGSVFNIRASSRLKIAVFAPMPSASESTATAVKPLLLSSIRTPNRRS